MKQAFANSLADMSWIWHMANECERYWMCWWCNWCPVFYRWECKEPQEAFTVQEDIDEAKYVLENIYKITQPTNE